MDSLTQATLGAAVGEAVLGRRIGNKAPIWGAALGTLPDLDNLLTPLFDPVFALAWHRGPSHSLLFAIVAGALIALGLQRLYRKEPPGYLQWYLFAFLCIFTHALLDTLTSYGTQLAWPFSTHPFALPTISIVDPLYTVPLLLGVIVAMTKTREREARWKWNRWGLILSTGYLLLTGVNKMYMESVFRGELDRQGIAYSSLMTNPTVLQNFLWSGIAATEDSAWIGVHSVFDGNRRVDFHPVEKERELLEPFLDDPAVERLLWFTGPYFEMRKGENDTLFLNDMHVGRRDAFVTDSSTYIFVFRLIPSATGDSIISFTQADFGMDPSETVWNRFWRRIWGDEQGEVLP